jgi:VWA domain-containing protein
VTAVRQWIPPSVLAVACLVVAACGDSGGPSSPADPLQLAVGVLVDSATFRSQGELVLDLVPSDRSGQTFVEDQWTIGVNLLAPSAVAVSKLSEGVDPADNNPVATAVLIDDSGSMRYSDPDRNRATAARLFWGAVLPARPGNVAALLDFGRGSATPSAGFQRTTLFAGFTSDPAVLDGALDQVQAVPGGSTPLYRSATEVMAWMGTTVATDSKRVLVVITDGDPSDQALADSLFATARAQQIRIFSVGIGAAADQNPASSGAILAQELATRTGGIYAAAELPTQLQDVLATLAVSTSPARLLVRVRLDPVPPPGATVSGTASVTGQRGTAGADWSFVAP